MTSDEVDHASCELGLPFPADYREFLLRYGGGEPGPYPIMGIRAAQSMSPTSTVVEENRHFRAANWPGIDEWLIISVDQGGNPVGIASDGAVYVSDTDYNEIIRLGNDFEDFLRRRCLKLSE